jgi:hypothetical protein
VGSDEWGIINIEMGEARKTKHTSISLHHMQCGYARRTHELTESAAFYCARRAAIRSSGMRGFTHVWLRLKGRRPARMLTPSLTNAVFAVGRGTRMQDSGGWCLATAGRSQLSSAQPSVMSSPELVDSRSRLCTDTGLCARCFVSKSAATSSKSRATFFCPKSR